MPNVTVSTSLARIQTDPASGFATAFFEQKTTIDDKDFFADWVSVRWSLTADKTIIVGDLELTYSQVSAFVTALAYQEKAAAEEVS